MRLKIGSGIESLSLLKKISNLPINLKKDH
jgi:hypothetical protein